MSAFVSKSSCLEGPTQKFELNSLRWINSAGWHPLGRRHIAIFTGHKASCGFTKVCGLCNFWTNTSALRHDSFNVDDFSEER